MIERVESGIKNLDIHMEGGFPKGMSVVLYGLPGTGKTTFCLQFVKKGLDLREPCVYITFDMFPRDLKTKMLMVGIDYTNYVDSNQLILIDGVSKRRIGITPEEERFYIEDPRDLNSISKTLMHALDTAGENGRLVVDSWTSISLNFSPSQSLSLVRFTEALILEARNRGYTTLIVSDFATDETLLRVLRHICSGFIELRFETEGESPQRSLIIHNMQFTNHRLGKIPFSMNSSGIEITK